MPDLADGDTLWTRVQYDGTNWNVTRMSDNAVQSFGALPATVDGVSISVASGAVAAGDSFVIKPTREGAAGFTVLVKQADRVAAAAPIRTAEVRAALNL